MICILGKLTKWIVIGILIFLVVSIVTSCIVLLGPDDGTSSTSPSPTVPSGKIGLTIKCISNSFFNHANKCVIFWLIDFYEDSIIFKAIGASVKPLSTWKCIRQFIVFSAFDCWLKSCRWRNGLYSYNHQMGEWFSMIHTNCGLFHLKNRKSAFWNKNWQVTRIALSSFLTYMLVVN